MKKIVHKPAAPLYAAAAAWVLYALLFPLYRPGHFVIALAASAVVYGIARLFCKDIVEEVPEEPKTTGNPELDQMVSEGQGALEEMRRLNDSIQDAAISAQIERLSQVSDKIFQQVQKDPSQLPQIRKFMSYYLPTTLKLLQSYRTMKTRGVSYSEMNTTRENLIHALDMILQAAQKQLDAMHKDDMLDMSADMDVLEQMLKRDGYMESVLSESLKEANRQQQNASVPYSTQQADLHTSGTAAARQMNQGAPVLKMPEEDIPEADRQQKKFYQN